MCSDKKNSSFVYLPRVRNFLALNAIHGFACETMKIYRFFIYVNKFGIRTNSNVCSEPFVLLDAELLTISLDDDI
jgi:hypothetical protein